MLRLFRQQNGTSSGLRLDGLRTILRPPVERDWRSYTELRAASRSFLEPWEPTWALDALSRDAFQRRLRRYASDRRNDTGYSFFVFDRESGRLVGGMTLSNVRRGVAQTATLGYWVGETYARKGYMTAAMQSVLGFGFRHLKLHRLEAACLPSNEPSQRLLQRAGFEQEGFAPKYLMIRGIWQDHILFALLAENYAPGKTRLDSSH